jgi:LuxR family transcriptional regulator of csgAB operon
MHVLQHKTDITPVPVPNTRIWIVGPNRLQNQLLCSFIEKSTGVACGCILNMEFEPKSKKNLLLYDCFMEAIPELWPKFEPIINGTRENVYLAFFNVDPDGKLESEFVERGVRGVFYQSESPEILSKGVEAILGGELWYSRKTTSAMLLQSRQNSAKVIKMAQTGLTNREKEILLAIAAGASNPDVAGKLHISPHTVKNHIYNIYRKIKVKSRLEAILWVTKHL